MDIRHTTLLVVGGGPGGYVAAIRAAQLGLHVTLVEQAALGGTCLNVGCIPSKALIHAAEQFDQARHQADGRSPLGIRVSQPTLDLAQTQAWNAGIVGRLTGGVGALLKKNGVQHVRGQARIIDGKTVEVIEPGGRSGPDTLRISCEHLLLATGSVTAELPFMPFGAGDGKVISSTEALALTGLPQRLVVVGAGYIGLELGLAWAKLGAEVHIVEARPQVLPAYDEELTRPVQASLQRAGVHLHLGHQVQGLSEDASAVRVRDAQGRDLALPADRVLVAVGRHPHTQGYGLDSLLLDRTGRAVKVDDQCRTSMRNVWAIGDLTGEPMLAHRAMAQGEMVAEIIAGHARHFRPEAIAAVCYTDPEVVVAGLLPREAEAAGLDCLQAQFPLAANGRAMTLESTDGFVRVVARRSDHRIVGWQAVGRGVAELATAFAQSLEMGALLEDVAGTIHAHPTLGEAVQEAAMRALGHALHL